MILNLVCYRICDTLTSQVGWVFEDMKNKNVISNDNIQCLLQDLLINNLQMSCYNCAKNYDFYTSNPKTKTSIFGISCFASLICSIILLQSGQNWFKENSSQWFLAWKIVGLIKDEMLWTTQWGKEKQTYMTDKHWEKIEAIVTLTMYVLQDSCEDLPSGEQTWHSARLQDCGRECLWHQAYDEH